MATGDESFCFSFFILSGLSASLGLFTLRLRAGIAGHVMYQEKSSHMQAGLSKLWSEAKVARRNTK